MNNMLRYILLLSLGLFAFTSQAQVDNKLRLGIDAQYDLPFGYETYYSCGIMPWYYQPLLYEYKRSLYFSTGATARYGLTDQIEIGSGLYFSRKHNSPFWYYGCPTCGDQVEIYVINYNDFIEVPLTTRFYVLPGKFKLHMELGQKFGMNINTFRGNKSDQFRYSILGGAGVNYFLNRFQFTLSANYSRQLNWQVDVNNLRNNLGISLNTSYSLGRN